MLSLASVTTIGFIKKHIMPIVLKSLSSKFKPLEKYVFEKNELDTEVESLMARVKSLEKMAHPMKEFQMCNSCKHKIKEK
tara:strand:- start:306 stop:545 length:240 start_codon:yes stop_codon:yes gene_type:complete